MAGNAVLFTTTALIWGSTSKPSSRGNVGACMLPEELRRDLKTGLRALSRERASTALAVVVLAPRIGAVTAMFSVMNGVMLRGFSFPNARRLASVDFIDLSSATFIGVNGRVSARDFEEFQPEQKSFEYLAAYTSTATVNVTVDSRPIRYTGAYVTENFLRAGLGSDR